MNIKKRHHYVWQHYLQPWTDQNNRVVCYFKEHKRFGEPNTKSIGVEGYFYRSHRLTDDDLKYLQSLIETASSPYQQDINQDWLKFLQQYYLLNDHLKSSVSSNEDQKAKDLEEILFGLEKMLFEELHTAIESSAKDILNTLRSGTQFKWTDENRINFLFYMMNQFMRTRRQKIKYMQVVEQSGAARLRALPNWCPERTWNIQAIMLATNLGFSIYREMNNYSFDLIKNDTSNPLITGDQPIVNLGNHEIQDIWMYYPLSPDFCLILQPKNNRKYNSLTDKDTAFLNEKIYHEALDQVYSNDQRHLEKIVL